MPSRFLGGSDIVKYNADIKQFSCPLTGRVLWATAGRGRHERVHYL